jgi:hypothetical protein
MKDTIQSWLVCLLPRFVCEWLWELDIGLGSWTPHILGRVFGVDAHRVIEGEEIQKKEGQ